MGMIERLNQEAREMQQGWITGVTGCPSAETIRRARAAIAAQRVVIVGVDRYGDPIKACITDGDETPCDTCGQSTYTCLLLHGQCPACRRVSCPANASPLFEQAAAVAALARGEISSVNVAGVAVRRAQ
jgi:hypothetical protein